MENRTMPKRTFETIFDHGITAEEFSHFGANIPREKEAYLEWGHEIIFYKHLSYLYDLRGDEERANEFFERFFAAGGSRHFTREKK